MVQDSRWSACCEACVLSWCRTVGGVLSCSARCIRSVRRCRSTSGRCVVWWTEEPRRVHAHVHARVSHRCVRVCVCACVRACVRACVCVHAQVSHHSVSGISWAICKSAPRSRQIPMPAPHHSVFYRPDALPAAQPIVLKYVMYVIFKYIMMHMTCSSFHTFTALCIRKSIRPVRIE